MENIAAVKKEVKDIPWVHYARVLACVMVVCLHSLPSGDLQENSRYFFYCVLALTRPCVPLFLMITGFLLLRKQELEIDAYTFYRKRIPRVLWPLLIWGVIYATLAYIYGKSDFNTFAYTLALLPVRYPQEIGGILWYLYMLIGLYLFLPFMSSKTWTVPQYTSVFIGMWFVASLFTFLRDLDKSLLWGTTAYTYDALLNFSGLLGYLILGRFLGSDYFKPSSRIYVFSIILFICGIALFFCGIFFNHAGYPTSYHMSFYSLPAILTAAAVFLFVKTINIGCGAIITLLSKLSFPIYLCHLVVYTVATKYLYDFSRSPSMMLFVMVSTYVGATLLAWILYKLPYHKYTIGT